MTLTQERGRVTPVKDSQWTLRRILQRAVEVLRTEGIRSLWFKILGETVYRRVVLLERPLNEPFAEITARLPLEINLLKETELEEYRRFRPETDLSDLRRRLEAGHFCFVARHQGYIVAAGWVATRRAWVEYLACEIQLAQDEVYVYELLTSPRFRSQNIDTLTTIRMFAYCRDAGYRRQIGVTVPENRPAMRVAEKTGFIRCGVMGYVKLGPWRWDFCRLEPNARPPGTSLTSPHSALWDGTVQRLSKNAHYLDTFLGALKRRAHVELIQRWDGVPTTGRVLKTDLFEEAIGPDAFLTELAGEERVVIGMDVSAAVACRAQDRDTNRQVQYVAADARRLPFADNSFALIVSPSTLDHFSDPRDLGRSLCELARILKPSGRLIITLDNRQNLFDPLLRLVNWLGWVPYYLGRSYRVEELRAELEAAGFVVQETTAILHNPRLMAVATVMFAKKLGWRPLIALVQRTLIASQRLEQTRWCYYTGSFVAAKAVRQA